MIKSSCIISLLFLLVGCVTGSSALKIRPGMNHKEVTAIMGQADTINTRKIGADIYETLKYKNRYVKINSWDKSDYIIELKNGIVVNNRSANYQERDKIFTSKIAPALANAAHSISQGNALHSAREAEYYRNNALVYPKFGADNKEQKSTESGPLQNLKCIFCGQKMFFTGKTDVGAGGVRLLEFKCLNSHVSWKE